MKALKNAIIKVVLYVRVSSKEQVDGYSIGEQVERLTKYCEAMGWGIVDTFIDPGYSGGDTNRPGLELMIDKIKQGGIDKVVVYKLDRLSRNQKDTLVLVEDVFKANGTEFVSMTENFDTATQMGQLMLGILSSFAQMEKSRIKERTMMGKEARAKEGKWNGGPTEPIGYDYNPAKDLLELNEYEKMQILELIDLFLENTPLRTIETMFLEKGYKHKHGVWTPKGMRRVLRSKIYCGYMHYGGEWYPAEHEHIFEEDTHEKLVKILDQRAEQYKLTGVKAGVVTTLFGGLLYCKHCGAKYTKQMGKKSKSGTQPKYYVCHSRNKKVKRMIKDPNCMNKNWKMGELDEILLAEIRKLATNPNRIAEIQKDKPKTDEQEKVGILKKEIEKIDEKISRFMDLYGEGMFTIDQVKGKVDPLNEQRKNMIREIDTINAKAGKLTNEEIEEIAETIPDVLDLGDYDEVRSLIETLIHFVEIDNDDVYVHWKFA